MRPRLQATLGERAFWGALAVVSSIAAGLAAAAVVVVALGALGEVAVAPWGSVVVAALGTLLLSLTALIIATPVAIGTALWVRWIAPQAVRPALLWGMATLGDIPSVFWAIAALTLISGWTPQVGLVLACLGLAAVASPTIARRALRSFDDVSEQRMLAARAMGASSSQAALGVALPSVWRGLVRSALLGFARAFGDAVVVLILLATLWPDAPFLPAVLFAGGADQVLPGALVASFLWAALALGLSLWARGVTR